MRDASKTIMLVEDDDVDVMNVKRAFKKNNITNPLYIANNGHEALAMLLGEGVEKVKPLPSVILLDINMPKMNGFDFLKQLRSDPDLKAISVFMLTTSNEQQDKLAAYQFNVAGYILKPVEATVFIDTIKLLKDYLTLIELPEFNSQNKC